MDRQGKDFTDENKKKLIDRVIEINKDASGVEKERLYSHL